MRESCRLDGSGATSRRSVGPPARALALVASLVLLYGVPASAQLVVYDAATTARTTITAALNQYLYETQLAQSDKIFEMARRLSALTNLAKYALAEVPRWRTHGSAVFAPEYLGALASGDANGVAYLALTQALERSDRLDRLPPAARRAVASRLATIDLTDAAAIAATHYTGQLRLGGRRNELPALDALEGDVINPSNEQSTTAVLDKISGAAFIGARQRQARIQLLTGVLEQLLMDSKRARDTDAASLEMQLVTWRDRPAADAAFVAGSANALRTWRQP